MIESHRAIAVSSASISTGAGRNTLARLRSNYKPLSKQERWALREVMTNAEIGIWRGLLDGPQKRKLNHPNAVVNRWKSDTQTRELREPRQPSLARDKRIAELEARNAELAEELASARSTGEPRAQEPDEDEFDEDDPYAGWTVGDLVDDAFGALAAAQDVDRWPPMPSRDQQELKKRFVKVFAELVRIEDQLKKIEKDNDEPAPAAEGGDKAPLVWTEDKKASFDGGKHHGHEASTAVGSYRISAPVSFPSNKFAGYEVAFVPPGGTVKDRVVLGGRVETVEQATAIAAKDYTSRN